MTLTIYELLILCGFPAICSFLFTWLFNKRREKRSVDVILRRGVQAHLRMDLVKYHDEYVKQGWIPLEVKSAYDNMYQQYHKLGKNGVMDDYHKEVMKLPTQPLNKANTAN